jgi:chromosomal replication initiation ATPase DnaA
MIKGDKLIADFFKQVHRGVNKFGAAKVMKKLQQLDAESYDERQREVIDFIILKVTHAFNISKYDLMESSKRGAVTDARKMCFILFKRNLDLSDHQIASYFSRVRQVVHRAMHEYEEMTGKLNHERDFLAILYQMEKECFHFRVSLGANKK